MTKTMPQDFKYHFGERAHAVELISKLKALQPPRINMFQMVGLGPKNPGDEDPEGAVMVGLTGDIPVGVMPLESVQQIDTLIRALRTVRDTCWPDAPEASDAVE